MGEGKKESQKVRTGFYIEQELLEPCDNLLEKAGVRSRNEFLNQALKYYIGYLTTEKIEDYLLQSFSSVFISTVQDTENRLARSLFKLAVEVSKLSNVIAFSQEIDTESLKKLHMKCMEEVKRINGTIKFEDAYQYQHE